MLRVAVCHKRIVAALLCGVKLSSPAHIRTFRPHAGHAAMRTTSLHAHLHVYMEQTSYNYVGHTF